MNKSMSKVIAVIVLLTIVLSACSQADTPAETAETAAPEAPENGLFLPPDNQVHLFVGQDLGAIGGFARYSDGYIDYYGMPQGITTYTDLEKLAGLNSFTNYGSGDVRARNYLIEENFDNTYMAIGLYLVDDLVPTYEGEFDDKLQELADFIIKYESPVFLRIGYEFNGSHNHYNALDYKKAYIYICDYLDNADVANYVSVWQATEHGSVSQLQAYYPGDEYVDYCGYSYFNANPNRIGQGMLEFAREHDKYIFIAEATPRVDIMRSDGEQVWNSWYETFIEHIKENQDVIKAVSYINCRWRTQPMWIGQGWGDSRLQIDEYISGKWLETLQSGLFTHNTIIDDTPAYEIQPEDEYPEGTLVGDSVPDAIEAESDAVAIGNVVEYKDSFASNGAGIAYIYEDGDMLSFENMPACNGAEIRYASNLSDVEDLEGEFATIGIYLDGERIADLEFASTGSWVESYEIIAVEYEIPAGSTFSIGYNEGDCAMNVDCIIPIFD